MMMGRMNVLRLGALSLTPLMNMTELTPSTPERVVRSSFMKRIGSRKSLVRSGSSSDTSVASALNILVMIALNPTELGFEVKITGVLLLWSSVIARRCPAPPITCTVYIIQFQVSWWDPRWVSTSLIMNDSSVVRLTALARM